MFKRVPHDCDDNTCVKLLRLCRPAIPAHGRLLVVDAVIPPGNDPHPIITMSTILAEALPT